MLKIISLYTGAGGLDLGLEAAGFETTIAIEADKWACQTLLHNRPTWNPIQRDIHSLSSAEIASIGKVDKGAPALLIGGPPCQPFSKSAYWAQGDTQRLNDPRADTLSAYLRVLKDLKPKAFLLENVFGITYKGKSEAVELLKQAVCKINQEEGTRYTFSLGIINAADYGVPQMRERVFIVGSRDGIEFRFPSPTHQSLTNKSAGLLTKEPWLTAWDAIGDLNNLEHSDIPMNGKWANLLPSIPEGKNYLHHTNRGGGVPLFGWRTRYWSFLLKLSKDKPSWTIQAQPGSAVGPFHWKNRRLSTRELCRLQTFPDSYEVLGSRAEIQRQLGNAVPSLIGEILGREIMQQFFNEEVTAELKLSINRNMEPHSEEPIVSVSEEFMHLLGQHEDHPGVGKGPRSAHRVGA